MDLSFFSLPYRKTLNTRLHFTVSKLHFTCQSSDHCSANVSLTLSMSWFSNELSFFSWVSADLHDRGSPHPSPCSCQFVFLSITNINIQFNILFTFLFYFQRQMWFPSGVSFSWLFPFGDHLFPSSCVTSITYVSSFTTTRNLLFRLHRVLLPGTSVCSILLSMYSLSLLRMCPKNSFQSSLSYFIPKSSNPGCLAYVLTFNPLHPCHSQRKY